METNSAILIGFLLVLLLIDCHATDLELKPSKEKGLDSQNGTSNEGISKSVPGLDSKDIDKVKKGGDEDATNMQKLNKNKPSESKEANNVQKDKGSSGERLKMDGNDEDKKEKIQSKEVPKDIGNKEVSLSKVSSDQECDPSNSCTDEDKKLIACLRVPGNDSPSLSLLIQNKWKGPLSVTISAPDFVKLEKTEVQLQEKDSKQVKVLIGKGESGNLIILTTGNGRCPLDFKDFVAQNSRKVAVESSKSSYNFLTQIPYIAIFFMVVLLIAASAWTYIKLHRKHLSKSGSKYQRLDMELPVSGGEKTESHVDDGWDNNWDDNWDDEEAPSTPSMPLTPGLSAKGLASRRFSKEGWKD